MNVSARLSLLALCLPLSASASAQVVEIGQYNFNAQSISGTVSDEVLLQVSLLPGFSSTGPELIVLGELLPIEDLSGTVFTIDSGSLGSGFAQAVERLSNGANDRIKLMTGPPSGPVGATLTFESNIEFADAFPCEVPPDFGWATIDAIEVTLNTFLPEVLAGDDCVFSSYSDCTSVRYDITVRLLGLPGIESQETVRLGTPPNPQAFVPGASGPIIGAQWEPRIDHSRFAPDAAMDILLMSMQAANEPTPFGTLLCDLGPKSFVLRRMSPPGIPFSISVPSGCDMVGMKVFVQGGSLLPDGSLHYTNALDPTIGSL